MRIVVAYRMPPNFVCVSQKTNLYKLICLGMFKPIRTDYGVLFQLSIPATTSWKAIRLSLGVKIR